MLGPCPFPASSWTEGLDFLLRPPPAAPPLPTALGTDLGRQAGVKRGPGLTSGGWGNASAEGALGTQGARHPSLRVQRAAGVSRSRWGCAVEDRLSNTVTL